MENASKALIIVGGILVAILVMSLAIYVLSSARHMAQLSEERITASDKQAFNRFFLYYSSDITGLDVYNIIGKIDDINSNENSLGYISYYGASKEDVNDTPEFLSKYEYEPVVNPNTGLVFKVYFTKI